MISGRKALASLAAVLFAATAAEGQTESYSSEDALLWDVTARDLIDPQGLAPVPSNVDAETGLRILPPTDSTFFTGQRLDLRIETQLPAGAPPVLERLTVNGVDITGSFNQDPAIKLIIEQAGRPTYSQDYLTNPVPLNPVPSSTETARPNPARDPDGLLLTGNMPSQGVVGGAPGGPVGVAPHSTDDVPLMAFGRGARLFRGVYENSDVSVRLVAALSGGSDPDELIPSNAPGGDALVFGRLEH